LPQPATLPSGTPLGRLANEDLRAAAAQGTAPAGRRRGFGKWERENRREAERMRLRETPIGTWGR